jgi:hypothetical protein
MDIIAAYREVGSYRGAAEMCGTTPKTVRRIIQLLGVTPLDEVEAVADHSSWG